MKYFYLLNMRFKYNLCMQFNICAIQYTCTRKEFVRVIHPYNRFAIAD